MLQDTTAHSEFVSSEFSQYFFSLPFMLSNTIVLGEKINGVTVKIILDN